jgi:phosphoribosylanthranilate isomerase
VAEAPDRRTRVKICGITRPEDMICAADHGADAIGLVFYPPSPRAVTLQAATRIAGVLPPFVTLVGLFVDPDPAQVEQVLAEVPVDLLQFHGDETPQACEVYRRPYIKAVRMRADVDLLAVARAHRGARGILADSYQEGVSGGTGRTFDWERLPAGLPKPLVLAGGLTPENVAEAVRRVRPYAVDVSGGVEASKGVKDPRKIAAFIRGVNRASAS